MSEGGCFFADRRGKTPEDALWVSSEIFSYELNSIVRNIPSTLGIRNINPIYKEWTFYGTGVTTRNFRGISTDS